MQLSTVGRLIYRYRADLLIAVGLMIFSGSASYLGSGSVDPAINSFEAIDVWFDSDAPRVFDNMVSQQSNYKRTDVHPLFGLVAFPPVYLIKSILSIDSWVAVRLVIATVAILWTVAFFILLRCIGLRRGDSTLFTLLSGVSAAAMFWFVVPETFSFGSVTILLSLILVAVACRCTISPMYTIAISVLTLSVTISNWVVGLLAAIAIHTKKQALQIIAFTICAVLVLSSLQLFFFPRAVLLGTSRRVLAEEAEFVLHGYFGNFIQSLKAFFFHSMVMPEIKVFDHYWNWLTSPQWKIMRVQFSDIGSGTVWGLIAIPLWCSLLCLGIWSVYKVKEQGRTRIVLAAAILFQLSLHSFYGRETFLYSLHFTPLLVVLTAFGALTPQRRICLALATALLIVVGINNGLQFRRAVHSLRDNHPPLPNLHTQTQMPISEKLSLSVYLTDTEISPKWQIGPGGSFSPGEDSFCISIWVLNGDRIVTTSDNFLAPSTTQQISWNTSKFDGVRSKVKTWNHYYQTLIEVRPNRKWNVLIQQNDNFMTRIAVGIRRTRLPGSPIHGLYFDGRRLIINNRWMIEVEPAPMAVQLGEEDSQGQIIRRDDQLKSEKGSGYVVFELSQFTHSWALVVTDLQISAGFDRGIDTLTREP